MIKVVDTSSSLASQTPPGSSDSAGSAGTTGTAGTSGARAAGRRDLATELRTRGYRMTPQRRMVLEAVEKLAHATPEEILHEVRTENPDVNASTIYRTLDLMEQLGLVSHAHLGHGAPSYHSGLVPAHAHLRCGACGEVTELPPEQVAALVESLRESHGFETNIRHLTVNGRCRRCQQAGATEA